MDFTFTPEQIELRNLAREFAEKEIAPHADKIDASYEFTAELQDKLAAGGFFGYIAPAAYGGKGISSVNFCILREEFTKVCTRLDETFIMQGLGSYPIVRFGNEKQKEKYLPALTRGEKNINLGLTDRGAGSDVAGISSTARREGDFYILNGKKRYQSNPGHTDLSIVFAKTDPEAGAKGISAFVVDREKSPWEFREEKLIFETNIGEMIFKDTRVPAASLLGEEGQGMRVAMANLDIYRPTVGAMALGMGGRALKLALDFVKNREMFGQKLVDFQVTQFKLAEMKVLLDASSLLVYRAAWLADNAKERTSLEASAAKYYATEAAQKIVDQSLQLCGGIGLQKNSRIEHLYRAIRAPRIYEGTSEIQLLVIGRELMKQKQLEHDTRL